MSVQEDGVQLINNRGSNKMSKQSSNKPAIKIKKKDGTVVPFTKTAIISAVNKSASRCHKRLTDTQETLLVHGVREIIDARHSDSDKEDGISTYSIHEYVMEVLKVIDEDIYREYFGYRDYKKRFPELFMGLIDTSKDIIYKGDKENANKDSQIISTKKELLAGSLSNSIMLEYEMDKEVAEAHVSGDIHIHDVRDRLFGSINCCLFDAGAVIKNGFLLNGVQYTEPTSAESFMRVLSDIILQASSQQYGGFTIPEIDNIGAPYVKKALTKSIEYYTKKLRGVPVSASFIKDLAYSYVERSIEQGFQAMETRLNTINNANGQTAFITISFGLNTTEEGRMLTKTLLKVRKDGIGKHGLTPVFPKLVFLHRYGVNGNEGDPNYDLYEMSLECMMKRIYPDMLSLNTGYLGEMYDKYGLAVSPMGCRAYLSPYYADGGMYPANPNDTPIFIGRANCGAVTLNTVRYAIKANKSKKKFYAELDRCFELALREHLATYARMCKIRASSNPLFFCEGGCHIKLGYDESIERAIKTFTWSFGYIGLTEASLLMTGKEIHEDNSFAIEVLDYINKLIDEAKEKHGLLFALYSTPAESLCFTFRNKDLKKFGVVNGVTDKEYYMNSFHVNVKAKITPFEKMDIEKPMFDRAKGGRIMYVEVPKSGNFLVHKQLSDKAMREGLYFGINEKLDSCCECGRDGLYKDGVCTFCNSPNIVRISRVCGYLSYRQVQQDSRYNLGKEKENDDRVEHTDFPISIGVCEE